MAGLLPERVRMFVSCRMPVFYRPVLPPPPSPPHPPPPTHKTSQQFSPIVPQLLFSASLSMYPTNLCLKVIAVSWKEYKKVLRFETKLYEYRFVRPIRIRRARARRAVANTKRKFTNEYRKNH